DLSKVKLNENGEVEGADELMKDLKEKKPYLFKTSTSTTSTERKPDPKDDKGGKKASEMSPEEWAREKKKLGLR
ncbi:MAG: hypothetical protein B7Z71_13790, partial [Acidocella sp. 21-58-7]